MDDAKAAEWNPPGPEDCRRDAIARGLTSLLEGKQFASFQPVHRQQTRSGQIRPDAGNANLFDPRKNIAIEHSMFGFAEIIKFLADPLADFLCHFACVDDRIEAPVQSEYNIELAQVG